MKPDILICVAYPEEQLALYHDDFEVHYAPSAEEQMAAAREFGDRIRGAVTTGTYGFTGDLMRALPKLEIVVTRGVGTENVDRETAIQRGIAVCNFEGGNFFAVAEHAMAILLAAVRRVPFDHAGVHQGRWKEHKNMPQRPLIWRKRLGILGLGNIGKAIAQRAHGFEVTVGYHNRNRVLDVPYRYFDTVLELAAESDILVVAVPGGEETRGLVSREVLQALGPRGFFVNVGRGTVVDTGALVEALKSGAIAGAAIDVVEGEPEVPPSILEAPNLVITPHVAGGAPETRFASIQAICDNLNAKFAGRPLKNRVA